ncbi:hypothetical protein HRR83_002119 [Exophiala dermatitidis]|uniref:Uncharacterized protein n=1 Tax=Exophiala dermatitidis TaxID=5970 RepID=A0AAN6IWU5_EXODE|nr:hypothetical protein HRR75_002017 [Exophiala dermatitidis]KAJ4524001.1 hypothetical protein HRR74_002196 [Exophiala dermatitidis]KAJ4525729.1 hypothetical protein HRR73_002461 [Exophiala dermatitidis]KAJ4537055.1 hypothetical protein HRR76_005072 [Exophiala dermatitidis]KAJ4555347.1 hypothetical protein HRR77_001283 [Exophiala dermatitidis]
MRTSVIALAVLGAATASASFVYPDAVPLHRRQEPGTPEYECHANCGGVIVDGRQENYCTSEDYKTKLAACLDCALPYDIWQYYGTSVTKAAQACGDDATPHPGTASSSSSEAPAPTSSAAPSSNVAPTSSAPGSSAATHNDAASSSASSQGAATTAATSSATGWDTATKPTGSSTASGTAPVATYTGAAAQVIMSGLLAVLPAGAMVAGLA